MNSFFKSRPRLRHGDASLYKRRKGKIAETQKDYMSAVFGYILMSIGIIGFLVMLAQQELGKAGESNPATIPVLFFITMLGFVCIHTELLMDQNNGLSTMRIVVFMMVNVICMLLLKFGWHNNDFKGMNLDYTWVTFIALVFGGKVAQSFVEHRFAPPGSVPADAELTTTTNVTPAIAKLAADQNRDKLKRDHPNINSVSDTIGKVNGVASPVVAIYLKDSNTAGILPSLPAALADGIIQNVPVEIITDVGTPRIQSLQSSQIWGAATAIERGSICALVSLTGDDTFRGVLTAGHVYSAGNSTNSGGPISDGGNFLISNAPAGNWCFQLITTVQDLAIGQIDPTQYTPQLDISFKNGQFYIVSPADIGKTQVTLFSAISGQRTGYILDYNNQQTITYLDNVKNTFTNIILVGNTTVRNDSQPVSEGGDSGGCVYVSDGITNKLVGLILGRDDKFTFVLPVQDTLNAYQFNLL